jgi:hypothetical protein
MKYLYKMKKNKYIIRTAGFFAILSFLIACEPQMNDKPDIGPALTADMVSFTVTPGADAFHFVVTNTSDVTGISYWDLGNGTKGYGTTDTVVYSIAGVYTVQLTFVSRNGYAVKSMDFTQDTTDYSLFSAPMYVNLTGGIADLDGKTWKLDRSRWAYIAVGPTDDPNGWAWWGANPTDKAGTALVDDEITFKLDGFVVTYDNKGKSYVKEYRKNDPALASYYLNPVQNDGDWDVNYTTPVSGHWTIVTAGSTNSLVIISTAPIFPCFDVGAKNNTYLIRQVTSTLLELTCLSSYESWTNWHYYLCPV